MNRGNNFGLKQFVLIFIKLELEIKTSIYCAVVGNEKTRLLR